MLTIRRLGGGDDLAVRAVFLDTLGLGSPLSFEPVACNHYVNLCLGWYLTAGRARARVVEHADGIAGYVLVCTDLRALRRWTVPRAAAFAATASVAALSRPPDDPALTFLRLRLRDGWALRDAPEPMPVVAHMNLLPSARSSGAARLLAEHVDDVCELVGAPGWYGEVNAFAGHRARALERVFGPVVHRAPNLTYSWLLGRPVERLTVVRARHEEGRREAS